jgi:1,4-dihydroxy-6-naphthoate synthase
MTGAVDPHGLEFEFELLDIQQLNDRMFSGDFDIAKGSFHAALLLAKSCYVLPSGSALGFGVGPLLLAANADSVPEPGDAQLTLCPGAHTTAALLFRMFYAGRSRMEHVLFSEIMPSLRARRADFGVCIHEGRFTYAQEGLSLVEDLGTRWEQTTNCPLPLGGIFANRNLAPEVIARAQDAICDSIEFGLRHPDATLPTMRTYAQAFNDEVLMQHVHLYVNDWTVELGTQGRQAIDIMSQLAVKSGIIDSAEPLEIFGSPHT